MLQHHRIIIKQIVVKRNSPSSLKRIMRTGCVHQRIRGENHTVRLADILKLQIIIFKRKSLLQRNLKARMCTKSEVHDLFREVLHPVRNGNAASRQLVCHTELKMKRIYRIGLVRIRQFEHKTVFLPRHHVKHCLLTEAMNGHRILFSVKLVFSIRKAAHKRKQYR